MKITFWNTIYTRWNAFWDYCWHCIYSIDSKKYFVRNLEQREKGTEQTQDESFRNRKIISYQYLFYEGTFFMLSSPTSEEIVNIFILSFLCVGPLLYGIQLYSCIERFCIWSSLLTANPKNTIKGAKLQQRTASVKSGGVQYNTPMHKPIVYYTDIHTHIVQYTWSDTSTHANIPLTVLVLESSNWLCANLMTSPQCNKDQVRGK